MGCSCVYVDPAYFAGEWVNLQSRVIKAAQPHICDECGGTIAKGDEFEFHQGYFPARPGRIKFKTNKTCHGCLELRDAFFCAGWWFGRVLEDLVAHLAASNDSLCCLDGFSPAAVEVLDRAVLPKLEVEENKP